MDGDKCIFHNKCGGDKWECRILYNMRYCLGDACSSFKTHEQVKEQEEACLQRLRSLPPRQQAYIKMKYRGSVLNRKEVKNNDI